MQDLPQFLSFLREYAYLRVTGYGHSFEKVKDLIVAFLIVKRGKYSSSFLSTSFFILVGATFIAGPVIVENNPFITSLNKKSAGSIQAAVLSYDPYESSLSTIFSVKPRDKVVSHTVSSGETLASIGKRYDISVDTIKWQNNLKSDVIKPGDVLKIPPVTGVVHKVIAGENIYTIAKKYKSDAQSIVNFPFNDFTDLETFGLMAGQTLYVPNGVIEEEQPKYAAMTYAQIQAGIKGSSTFIWPTTGIMTQYPAWYHMAFDIANPSSPPILASDTGTVVFSGCVQGGYGCHIIVDHGNGFQTLYAHMSFLGVSAGTVVNQGQTLGNMGSTGRSTGTHLHFEIRLNGVLQNPQGYLK